MFFISCACLGFIALKRVPVDLEPTKTFSEITVTFSLKDAPPEVVEQEATAPLENVLSQVSGLKSIKSVSNYQDGSIVLRFDAETNMASKQFEVTSIIRYCYDKLNPAISYPLVEQKAKAKKLRNPLLVYSLNANLATFKIREIAKDIIIPALLRLPDVSDITINGSSDIQLSIDCDFKKLKQYGISTSDIKRKIETVYGTFFPGATITSDTSRLMIKGGDGVRDLSDLKKVMISMRDGSYVPLDKFAELYFEESLATQYLRINGINTITISIYTNEFVNRSVIGKELQNQLKLLEAQLPAGSKISKSYDDTEFVRQEINKNVFRSSISFLTLFAFIALSYRSVRDLVVLLSGILISLGSTAILIFLFSIEIHLYTIAATTISIGILIDNSIIVLEAIKRKKNQGLARAQLASAVITILSLMFVFLLPEEETLNLTDFSIVLSISIGCSFFTAIFYTPAAHALLSERNKSNKPSLLYKKRHVALRQRYKRFIYFLSRHKNLFVTGCVLAFGLPLFDFPPNWKKHRWFENTFGTSFYQEKIQPLSERLLGGSLRLFINEVSSHSGYRSLERTNLLVQAFLSEGQTIADVNRIMAGMEHYLSTVKGIDKYVTNIYSAQHATINVYFLKEHEAGPLPFSLKNQLVKRSLDWGGIEWAISGAGPGFSNFGGGNIPNFKIIMKGYNYDQLGKYADSIAKKLLNNKRIQNVNTNDRLNWNERNFEQLTLKFASNVSSGNELTSQLSERARSYSPSFFLPVNHVVYPVYFKDRRNEDISKFELMQLPLVLPDSQLVTLSTVATVKPEIIKSSIHKEERSYIRVVGFDYQGNYVYGNEYLEQVLAEVKKEMAPGYSAIKNTGDSNWISSKQQYLIMVFLALVVYLTACVLFENFKQPLYIVVLIPLSFVGVFLTFYYFNIYFDQGGFASLILVGALVSNASIHIVNDVSNAKRRNYNRQVISAVTRKVKPITFIIASTCLGLLPLIVGNRNEIFWFSLASGTLSGLIFSTITLFVCLPVFMIDTKRLRSNHSRN